MSLIHTCQLCGANSFDYLVELQRHAQEPAARPSEWMPWNYRETLARIGSPVRQSYDQSDMAEKKLEVSAFRTASAACGLPRPALPLPGPIAYAPQ